MYMRDFMEKVEMLKHIPSHDMISHIVISSE